MLLHATNRLAEAEPLYRRALAIDEASYGPDHPDVATDLNNLAALLQATNRLAEAEPLYRRALAIDEASYGPDHPDVATVLNNLAVLLQATNRLAEAEPLSRRQLEILLQFHPRDRPRASRTSAAANNYAGLLTAMGWTPVQIKKRLNEMARWFGVSVAVARQPGVSLAAGMSPRRRTRLSMFDVPRPSSSARRRQKAKQISPSRFRRGATAAAGQSTFRRSLTAQPPPPLALFPTSPVRVSPAVRRAKNYSIWLPTEPFDGKGRRLRCRRPFHFNSD